MNSFLSGDVAGWVKFSKIFSSIKIFSPVIGISWSTILQGFVKSVGVSNYGVQHLEGLKKAGRPAPSVSLYAMLCYAMYTCSY